MTEFEGQVLADLSVLKSQMRQLFGVGQPGRLTQLEERVERHERSVQRMKGWWGLRRNADVCASGDRLFAAVTEGWNGGDYMDFMKLFLRIDCVGPGCGPGDESMFGAKTGEQKKAAAVEIVGAAINIANAVTQKHIADSDKFTAGLGKLIIDGVVKCLNASLWAKR